MNLNISTINVLPATPVQPVSSNLARGSAKTDSFDGFEKENSRISSDYERFGAKKWGKQSATEGVIRRDDIQSSDNIAYGTRISEEEPRGEGFENVFRRQLRPNESLSESGNGKVEIKPQKTDIPAKSGELQQSISLQSGVTPLVEQEKPTEDLQQEPKQTNQILKQTVSQTTESSLKDTRSADDVNQGKNVQKEVLQQTAIASNQTKPVQSVLSATAEGTSVQQDEQQRQITGTQETSADGKQTTGNTSTIKPGSVDNAGLGKTVETTNQHKPGGDAESVDFSSRQGAVQSKIQSAALSAETFTGNSITSRVQEQITAGGQQGVTEAANNARVKDKAGSDRQVSSRQLPANAQETGGLANKLEKIEVLSGKSGTPKSESGGNTVQASRGPIADFGAGQAASDASPVIAGRATTTASSAPIQDTSASVREQIYQSVKTSVQEGASQITIRLNPPELGQVSVKFSQQGKELTGLLEATNPQTRAEIRQAIPEIIRSLEESGVSIKRIDVMLSSDSPRSSAQQQSLRDNNSGALWEQFSQHSFQDTGGNRPSHDSYLTPTYSDNPGAPGNDAHAVTPFGRNQSLPSDNLLDILI